MAHEAQACNCGKPLALSDNAAAWDGRSSKVWADIQQGMLKHVPIPRTSLLAWLSYLRPQTQVGCYLYAVAVGSDREP
jgi:hypothetical protein